MLDYVRLFITECIRIFWKIWLRPHPTELNFHWVVDAINAPDSAVISQWCFWDSFNNSCKRANELIIIMRTRFSLLCLSVPHTADTIIAITKMFSSVWVSFGLLETIAASSANCNHEHSNDVFCGPHINPKLLSSGLAIIIIIIIIIIYIYKYIYI